MEIIRDPGFRKWVYGVAAAILALLAAFGIIRADHETLYIAILTAILDLSGSAAFVMAARNARPSTIDDKVALQERGKYGDYSEEIEGQFTEGEDYVG